MTSEVKRLLQRLDLIDAFGGSAMLLLLLAVMAADVALVLGAGS